jgi:eukaryotic-like serine/threonine-protein kinase
LAMTEPSKWNFIESVFFDALDLPVEERERFVRDRCAGDSNSAEEVLSLLEAHFDGPPLIDGSLLTLGMKILAGNASDDESPAQVGRYRITRELGHGGMAVVFLAEREEGDFQHRVAVKVMRGGRESRSLLARFVTERQVLATLDHPNIARLYDGGVTERGVPYIVMEYVDGAPFLEYCRKNLPELEDRLRLFTKVCDAVQHAHRNLIVHRDLKPGNILVMADGTPKLLDFGIAKIFRDDFKNTLAQTAAEERLLTPAYASPEQIRGKNITTATDVYSLGVIFYELLSGDSPYSKSRDTYEELIAAICDRESVRPSAAVENAADEDLSEVERRRRKKRVSGDLDIIALKALAKDPARRYASVDQMAEDIRRHLDGRPISARPDTVRYRVTKFVKRNRWQTAAAVLVMASMLSGTGVALWQARKAELERVKAEQSQKKAKDRADSIQKLCGDFIKIHDEIQNLPNSTRARKLLLGLGVSNLDELANENLADPKLSMDLARSYKKFGDLQGGLDSSNIGQVSEAIKSYQKAKDWLSFSGENIWKERVEIELRLSIAKQQRGQFSEARLHWLEAERLYEMAKSDLGDSDKKILEHLLKSREINIVTFSEEYGKASALAVALVNEGEKKISKNQGEMNENDHLVLIKDRMLLASTYNLLGERLRVQLNNSPEKAVLYEEKALECYEKCSKEVKYLISISKRPVIHSDLLYVIKAFLLEFRIKVGKEKHFEQYHSVLKRLENVSKNDLENLEARYEHLFFKKSFGLILFRKLQLKEAQVILRETLAGYEELLKVDSGNQVFLHDVSCIHFFIGEALSSIGLFEKAISHFRKSFEISAGIILQSPQDITLNGKFLIPSVIRLKKYYGLESKEWKEIAEIGQDISSQLKKNLFPNVSSEMTRIQMDLCLRKSWAEIDQNLKESLQAQARFSLQEPVVRAVLDAFQGIRD